MPEITLLYSENEITVSADTGTPLMILLQKYVPEYVFPCGGNHTCGKCVVEAEGMLSPPTAAEQKQFPAGSNLRLACSAAVAGDCRIHIRTGEKRQSISRAFRANVHPGKPLFPGKYGAAIDIGTTTIVAYLFRSSSSDPCAVVGRMNEQRAFGSDVLSRIVYSDVHGVSQLQDVITRQLGQMLHTLCVEADLCPGDLSGCVITGNTTMLTLLTGLDPHGIGVAPFLPPSLFGITVTLPIPGYEGLPCYLPPCISAYVGADITCSILASQVLAGNATTLLIDAGTNGEMALCRNGKLYCCSTAAGPAFEGANISCGMQAQSGAIDRIWADNGTLCFHTIGDEAPKGLCGSGLIDAVSAGYRAGLLDKRGRPAAGCKELLIGSSGISLTRKDISELLLAKAAIRAGIETLMTACGITAPDLDACILCGGFGSFLNVESAVGIGMLPRSLAGKTTSIGNAAGAGAAMILQDETMLDQVRNIIASAETTELSGSPVFNEFYVKSMRLD